MQYQCLLRSKKILCPSVPLAVTNGLFGFFCDFTEKIITVLLSKRGFRQKRHSQSFNLLGRTN